MAAFQLPRQSPNLNPHAERFVRSIRSEALDRIVPLGEAHLRHVIKEFLVHYHAERNHQGLESRLLEPGPEAKNDVGAIVRRKRLGGLLSYYYHAA